MIKTGLESVAYFSYDDYRDGLKKLKSHGYDCVDYRGFFFKDSPLYNMDENELKSYLLSVKKSAEDAGVEISQLHALLSRNDETEEVRADNFKKYISAIKGASVLGCKNVVIHPLMPFGWEKKGDENFCRELNEKTFSALMPYAEDSCITVCVENLPFPLNMPSSHPNEIKQLVRNIDNEHCKICLDTGHANVLGVDFRKTVNLLGEDLVALHVHDNYGLKDEHRFPYFGTVDWDGFLSALKDIGYKGSFILEVHVSNNLPEPIREEMRISLAKLARTMANKME